MIKKTRIFLDFIILLAGMLIIFLLVNLSIVQSRKSMVLVEFETIADYQVNEKFRDIQFLAAVWGNLIQANDGVVKDFSNRSERILRDYSDSVVESLKVAPNGVMEYVYPYSFSDEIGKDLFTDGVLSEVTNRSKFAGMDVVSEPELLENGDYRLSFCHPVYVKDKVGKSEFWGFSIVTVRISDLFSSIGLKELGVQSSYKLYRLDARNGNQLLFESTGHELRDPVFFYFSAPNGVFALEGSWTGGWVTGREILIEIAIGFGIMILALLLSMNMKFRKNMRNLSKISYTDELTGLYNRHMLRTVFDKLNGNQKTVSILFVDFDHFKDINDNEGHDAGDAALKQGAEFFVSVFGRESCYRYGGDEFLLLMVDIPKEEALQKAARLSELTSIHFQNREIPVAMSGGFASAECCNIEDLRALIRQADENLYHAKEGGRNRIIGGQV